MRSCPSRRLRGSHHQAPPAALFTRIRDDTRVAATGWGATLGAATSASSITSSFATFVKASSRATGEFTRVDPVDGVLIAVVVGERRGEAE